MDKIMMNHCPTWMREVFAFLLLIAASPLLAQEDCDNIVTIPELAAQVQEWQDDYHAVQVDTIIMLSEDSYEVHLTNGTTFTQVLGCTDPAYIVYSAEANVDDGSCATLVVEGCTDPAYIEYSAEANVDDGSCATFVVEGCTDPAYIEYSAEANTDDGSCASHACSNLEFDGYTYSVVEIGDQCWFAENLRSTVYADGTTIPEVTDNTEWAGLSSGARCDFDNNSSNVASYGRLYNWYAVNSGSGLCPSGWYVPTDAEWTDLEVFITSQGFDGTEGTALKSTTGWSNNGNGTDYFGFSALPGGQRHHYYGYFYDSVYSGYWWSSSYSVPSGGNAWYRELYHNGPGISRSVINPRAGFSVRCLRDAE